MNNMKIVAATGNKHKIEEIESITKKFGMNVITKAESGVGDLEVEETGTTFEENSLIKAEDLRLTRSTALRAFIQRVSQVRARQTSRIMQSC